jgi:hypothetical protein
VYRLKGITYVSHNQPNELLYKSKLEFKRGIKLKNLKEVARAA